MPRHVVRPGDTIKSIGKKYKCTPENILSANLNLKNYEKLSPGDIVHIPDNSTGAYLELEVRPLKPQLLSMLGLSVRQIQEHYKLYQNYIVKINEIRTRLRTVDLNEANVIYSSYRSLKIAEAYSVNGYKLHELYFDCLGGRGGTASGALLEAIVRDFGSYDFWEKDFKACALSCDGWVILCYDYDDGHLHNYGLDTKHEGTATRIEPLLVLDVKEHAYFLDYGTNRSSYIDAFFRNIDWPVINSRLLAIKRE